jgi:hypothetical protein
MLTRIRRIPEPYRVLLIGVTSAVVLIVGRTWPSIEYAIWCAFGAMMLGLLYADLRQPSNYDSLQVVAGVIEYIAMGHTQVISLADVTKLEFVREEALFSDLNGPYLETKWLLQCGTCSPIEVMDEWPHRSLLLEAFTRHLPTFNAVAARSGLQSRGEGRWLCYEAGSPR